MLKRRCWQHHATKSKKIGGAGGRGGDRAEEVMLGMESMACRFRLAVERGEAS